MLPPSYLTGIVGLALAIVIPACSSQPARQPTAATPSAAITSTSGSSDVGGYKLTWTCQGEGSPTIVAEAGYDTPGTSAYGSLMEPLSDVSRVCSYDRAGTGTSDARPDGRHVTSLLAAEELHAMLKDAAIPAPFVLVAHSYGGFVARLFAATYPSETAGLVLLDSSHEDEIIPYRRHYGTSRTGDWVDGGDLIDIDATSRALQATARDFGAMPLVVVKAGRYEDVLSTSLWNRTQADLATLSSNSTLIQAAGGHFVMDDDPLVVIAATSAVVMSARTGDVLPQCRDIVVETDGRCP